MMPATLQHSNRVARLDPALPATDLRSFDAHAYLALVRRYIRGKASPGNSPPSASGHPFTTDQCAALLAQADRKFAAHLAPLYQSASKILGADPRRLAIALNHMHHDSQRLTMCTDELLDNMLQLTRSVLDDGIPGDFIEAGVWRGGMTIWMRAVLNTLGDSVRTVWAADSFEGLPAPNPAVDLRDAICHDLLRAVDLLTSDLADVKAAFARIRLLDAHVRFLPGWFADTLPDAPIERLALIRLDGDWCESTRDAIEALYPRLSPGGYVIVDDYGTPTGCARAIDEYRARHGIAAPLTRVGVQAVYWRKP